MNAAALAEKNSSEIFGARTPLRVDAVDLY
jgi:hypothetical protein